MPSLETDLPTVTDDVTGDGAPLHALAGVRTIAAELIKGLKALRLYEEGNRVVEQRLTALANVLASFLGENARLDLAIQPFALTWHGEVVHQNPEQETSVPFRLYRTGLRALSFTADFEPGRIRELLAVLNTESKEDDREEDDVVTLLWERNLPGVEYQVAEDLAAAGDGRSLDQFLTADNADGGGAAEVPVEAADLSQLTAPDSLPTESVSLSAEETAQLGADIEHEESRDLLLDVLDILFEASHLSQDPDERLRMREVACQMQESLLEGTPARRVLTVLVRALVLKEFVFADSPIAQDLGCALAESLGRPAGVAGLRRMCESLPPGSDAVLKRVLRALPETATPCLVREMGYARLARTRTLFREVIAERPETWLGVVEEALGRTIGAPAHDLVELAARAEWVDPAPLLERATRHVDASVRRLALRRLAERSEPAARELLIAALDDSDDRVRGAALSLLIALGGPEAGQRLYEVILSQSFSARSDDERRALLIAYATLAGDESVRFLRSLLLRRSWLTRSRVAADCISAAHALGRLDSERSRAALEQGERGPLREVREVCRALLARLAREEAT